VAQISVAGGLGGCNNSFLNGKAGVTYINQTCYNDCNGNGNCIETEGVYSCQCFDGYRGQWCDLTACPAGLFLCEVSKRYFLF
jgi:hypothetical protein